MLAAVLGGYVLFFELQKGQTREPDAPWFYNVNERDITQISVTHLGENQTFNKQDGSWYFDNEPGSLSQVVNIDRWGGIPLLVTGPRSSRLLEENVSNLAQFGLSEPVSHISILLRDGRQVNVLLGDLTADGSDNYASLEGSASVFLVDATWGEVLNRLVSEPPVLPEAPVPSN